MSDTDSAPEASDALRVAMDRVELFAGLPAALLDELETSFEALDVDDRAVVVAQGDAGEELFIVGSGRLEVTIQYGDRIVQLGVLETGDIFGEMALLGDSVRTATVTARAPGRLWKLSRSALVDAARRAPELATRLRESMRRRQLANALRSLQ